MKILFLCYLQARTGQTEPFSKTGTLQFIDNAMEIYDQQHYGSADYITKKSITT